MPTPRMDEFDPADGSVELDFPPDECPFPEQLPKQITNMVREKMGFVKLPDGSIIIKTASVTTGKEIIRYRLSDGIAAQDYDAETGKRISKIDQMLL